MRVPAAGWIREWNQPKMQESAESIGPGRLCPGWVANVPPRLREPQEGLQPCSCEEMSDDKNASGLGSGETVLLGQPSERATIFSCFARGTGDVPLERLQKIA